MKRLFNIPGLLIVIAVILTAPLYTTVFFGTKRTNDPSQKSNANISRWNDIANWKAETAPIFDLDVWIDGEDSERAHMLTGLSERLEAKKNRPTYEQGKDFEFVVNLMRLQSLVSSPDCPQNLREWYCHLVEVTLEDHERAPTNQYVSMFAFYLIQDAFAGWLVRPDGSNLSEAGRTAWHHSDLYRRLSVRGTGRTGSGERRTGENGVRENGVSVQQPDKNHPTNGLQPNNANDAKPKP